ncbi:MAG: Holliday junction branch migration protein RuvA [Clostridia bacterium]
MFYYLNGEVTVKEQNLIVVDVNGVGYAVHTSLNTLSKVELNKKHKLYTYCNIREDAFDIFGFYDMEELNFYKLLTGITGVGPKAALSILSVASPESLALAIITGDEKLITRAVGIGKKIASRIVLELKDKIAKEQISSGSVSQVEFIGGDVDNSNVSEAISALMVLGYSQSEATQALRGVDGTLNADQIIKIALKNLLKQ